MKPSARFSRRTFLKAAGLGGAALGLAEVSRRWLAVLEASAPNSAGRAVRDRRILAGGWRQPGEQTAFLAGRLSGEQRQQLRLVAQALGASIWLQYDASAELEGQTALADAAQRLFGAWSIPRFDLSAADCCVFVGAHFGESWLSATAFPASVPWIILGPYCPAALIGKVTWRPVSAGRELTALLAEAPRWLKAGRPLFVPGALALSGGQAGSLAQAILSLNALAGQVGQGVWLPADFLCEPDAASAQATLAELSALLERIRYGLVKTLVLVNLDPLVELPRGLGVSEALAKLERLIVIHEAPDAVARIADLAVPWQVWVECSGLNGLLAEASPPRREAFPQNLPPVLVCDPAEVLRRLEGQAEPPATSSLRLLPLPSGQLPSGWALLHPLMARRRRIISGQRLQLITPDGEVYVRARLSPAVIPEAVGLSQEAALRLTGSRQNSTGSLDASAVALKIQPM